MTSIEALILEHRTEDVNRLSLKWHGMPEAAWMIAQVEGWQKLRKKVPSWTNIESLHYPKRLSVEQCSSEQTAKYKADIIRRKLQQRPHPAAMADITGGFGVDCSFLSPLFSKAFYVERDEALCSTMHHNAPLLQLDNLSIVNEDGTEWLQKQSHLDFVFIDPARRSSGGKKLISLLDCEPNVVDLLPTLKEKATWVMLKLSPMLDISMALKQTENYAEEVHILGVNGECKELLLLMNMEKQTSDPIIVCTDGKELLRFTQQEENTASFLATSLQNENTSRQDNNTSSQDKAGSTKNEDTSIQNEAISSPKNTNTPQSYYATDIAAYLYEPNPTILKAGAFHTVAKRYSLQKLHPNTHLYTANTLVTDFPGRVFRVISVIEYSKKELKKISNRQTNLSARNFSETTEQLRKKLRLRDGGSEYWFATTYFPSRKAVIICEKA